MPIHPMIVHIPIALAMLMPLISIGLVVAWWRGWLSRRVWLIALALQALLVIGGFAAMQTGEADEERVEVVVPESVIEHHEEAAETFVWTSTAVLVVMFGAALLRKEGAAQIVASGAALGTLAVLGLGYQVGDAGGRMVYEHNAASVYTGAKSPSPSSTVPSPHHDDDD